MMGVMLQRDIQNQRLYIHDVVLEIKTPDPSREYLDSTGSLDGNERLYLTNILDSVVDVKKSIRVKQADTDNRAGSNSRGSENSSISLRDDSNSITPNVSNRINIVNQIPDEEDKKKADRQYTCWIQETEVARGMYGDFDMQAELQNPRFRHLLRSGISVPDAYLVTHREEILINAVRAGLRRGEENVNRRVEENRRRPRENGLDPGAAFITRPNPAKMTKADRLSIARRAQKGEKIIF